MTPLLRFGGVLVANAPTNQRDATVDNGNLENIRLESWPKTLSFILPSEQAMFHAGFYRKKSLLSHSRVVMKFIMCWVRALLVKRCYGRLLKLFELFPNHAKIKTRKAWSDGVLLSLV